MGIIRSLLSKKPNLPEQIPKSQFMEAEEKDNSGFDEKVSEVIIEPESIVQDSNGLKESIMEIAAVIEELSANTEETAATTEEMNAMVVQVNEKISDMASGFIDSMELVGEISSRAERIKQEAIESEDNAQRVCHEFGEILKTAVEKATVINEIDSLTSGILSIATTINLISINASIEAAHAGEHGRGFTIVALEIKRLAEQTKQLVLNIKQTSKVLKEFLSGLIESSESITGFMERQVIGDYRKLVDIGEEYNSDASRFSSMMEDYACTVDMIISSMRSIVEGISAVSSTTEENARGTSEIAEYLSCYTEKTATVV